MRAWTLERLDALSHAERYNLWINAKKAGDAELIEKIESSGLPYSNPAGVKFDDEIGRAIKKLVNSKEGTAAAIASCARGRPALEGIDVLLQRELGDAYRTAHEGTIQAGYAVALRMRRLGYHDAGRKPLRDDCVAKRGIVFVKQPI
jgi:hypothetical protein